LLIFRKYYSENLKILSEFVIISIIHQKIKNTTYPMLDTIFRTTREFFPPLRLHSLLSLPFRVPSSPFLPPSLPSSLASLLKIHSPEQIQHYVPNLNVKSEDWLSYQPHILIKCVAVVTKKVVENEELFMNYR
jgi:hypothetical protein